MTAYSAAHIRSARSFLFVPGHRPERFAKAAASGADVVVIDLEDAVADDDKTVAREHVRQWVMAGNAAMVRINGAATVWYDDDRAMVSEVGAAVMVPKAETPDVVGGFPSELAVVALVETAAGITELRQVCATAGVHRIAFGSIDLGAQLGIDPTDREALLTARSQLVLASAAAGLAAPIDGVTTVISEPQPTMDDMRYARRLGFTAKLCIHPTQVAMVHDACAPTDEQIAWAKRILESTDSNAGASSVDGQMVDLPVLHRARSIVEAAQRN